MSAGSDIAALLQSKDSVAAFNDADLMMKRKAINFLCEVRLHPHPRGRKTFDRETVKVTPKG